MGLGGVISNTLSIVAKLLPAVNQFSLQPSSSLSSHVESHQIETELKELMRLLERIKVTLYDAEGREIRDISVKLWLKELREVAYDAEDVLDEYHYEVLRAQVEARAASPANSQARKLIQVPVGMLNQIQHIRSKFAEIAKDRIALQLTEEDGPRCCNSDLQITPTSHFVIESDIIGREREKEELIDLLSSENHDGEIISVVTIVGTGGIGKTTLARLVYNAQRIKQKFDKFVWICVPEDFNVQRLTREVIESITRCSDLTNLSVLQEKLSEEMRGKKVFLVLDDVWNENRSHWELFLAPFRSASLVKVLVTTRNETVAQIMQTMPTFNLGYTSEEKSWQMFQHYAFGEVIDNTGSNLEEIGKKIMKKCGMLPLAIRTIASLLRHETEEESWKEILKSELWESDVGNEIFPSLQISYNRLPTYLKPCFLYCSMFPRDYRYSAEELVRLWIYQGYVQSNGLKSAEKIGEEYAKQLWQRSFFEGKFGEELQFTLHDMIHDLARFNSGHKCYSLEGEMVPYIPEELYHLYVSCWIKFVGPSPSLHGKFAKLRTLIVKGNLEKFLSAFTFSEAQKLRALQLVSGYVDLEFHFSFVNLKHLRCLSLSNGYFERLPESICFLYNLHNLTIENCTNLTELPRSMKNLICLEELRIVRCHALTVLPESLPQLQALRKLYLRWCSKLEKLPSNMGNLTNLQLLRVCYIGIVSSLPPSFHNIIRIPELEVKLYCKMIGWLEDFVDLEGTLCLVGLNKQLSLKEVHRANLVRMHNLQLLILNWFPAPFDVNVDLNGNGLVLYIHSDGDASCETDPHDQEDASEIDDQPNSLMVGLQPHRNLKEIKIEHYCGLMFANWITNPILCASLASIELVRCKSITFLPFGSLDKLKYLKVIWCSSLQFIYEESLPLALREIKILYCESLISVTGTYRLKSLVQLYVMDCKNLYLLDHCYLETCTITVSRCPKLRKWCSEHDLYCERSELDDYSEIEPRSEASYYFRVGASYHSSSELDDYSEIEPRCPKASDYFQDSELETEIDSNLKKLDIHDYHSCTFPDWIGNPVICSSLESIELVHCKSITFLPFGSLDKLKYLKVAMLPSLQNIQAESLPSVLKEREIWGCESLISVTGIQKLKSLVKLDITYCANLCWLDSCGKADAITISGCPNLRELCLHDDISDKGIHEPLRDLQDTISPFKCEMFDLFHDHDHATDKRTDLLGKQATVTRRVEQGPEYYDCGRSALSDGDEYYSHDTHIDDDGDEPAVINKQVGNKK